MRPAGGWPPARAGALRTAAPGRPPSPAAAARPSPERSTFAPAGIPARHRPAPRRTRRPEVRVPAPSGLYRVQDAAAGAFHLLFLLEGLAVQHKGIAVAVTGIDQRFAILADRD